MELLQNEEIFYRILSLDEDIYKKFNTSKENILRNNYEIPFYVGEWVRIRINDYITHIVKPAQNIEQIATIHNVDKNQIISDNNLSSEKLFIGQTLKIFKTQK